MIGKESVEKKRSKIWKLLDRQGLGIEAEVKEEVVVGIGERAVEEEVLTMIMA